MSNQVVKDLYCVIFIEDVCQGDQEDRLDYRTQGVVEAVDLFLQFSKVPAEKIHDGFGGVGVVLEHGPEPVHDKGK